MKFFSPRQSSPGHPGGLSKALVDALSRLRTTAAVTADCCIGAPAANGGALFLPCRFSNVTAGPSAPAGHITVDALLNLISQFFGPGQPMDK